MDSIVLTEEVVQEIRELHVAASSGIPDPDRDAADVIMMDRFTQLFRGPGDSILYLRDIVPGGTASLHVLSRSPFVYRRKNEFRKVLKEVMDLFSLHKIHVVVPASAKHLMHLTQFFDLLEEGRLREATTLEGKRTDLVIFGILRRELDNGELTLVERTFSK